MQRRNLQLLLKSPIEETKIKKAEQDEIYLEKVEDGVLYYIIKIEGVFEEEETYYPHPNEEFISLVFNGETMVIDAKEGFLIPTGSHELHFYMKRLVYIDQYQSYKALELEFSKNDQVTFSDEFSAISEIKSDGSRQFFFLKGSEGKYIPKHQRLEIYQKIKETTTFLKIYTILNFSKIVIFFMISVVIWIKTKRNQH